MSKSPFLSSHRPLVIAHQGGQGLYPSNTIYALEKAYALGVDIFELDIHLSKDGHIVVIHDATVDRTTNGHGKITEMNLSEIQALDAGYYWTTDNTNYPYRNQGIQIPTLAEVFESFPSIPIIVDIKQNQPSLVHNLSQLLYKHNKSDDVIIGCYSGTTLNNFRTLCPSIPTSMYTQEVRNMVIYNYTRLNALFKPKAVAAQVPMKSGKIQIINPRFLRLAKQRNMAVHVWTINKTEEMEYLINLGVDGIMTDYPNLLLDVIT